MSLDFRNTGFWLFDFMALVLLICIVLQYLAPQSLALALSGSAFSGSAEDCNSITSLLRCPKKARNIHIPMQRRSMKMLCFPGYCNDFLFTRLFLPLLSWIKSIALWFNRHCSHPLLNPNYCSDASTASTHNLVWYTIILDFFTKHYELVITLLSKA